MPKTNLSKIKRYEYRKGTILVTKGASFVDAAMNEEGISLWFKEPVYTDTPKEEIPVETQIFTVVSTGEAIPENTEFVKTLISNTGNVLHLLKVNFTSQNEEVK